METELQLPEWLAAVDLGSNSFHLKVARVVDGQLQIVDRLREMVRLASGLDEKNNLTDETIEAALDCLQRFGQRLRDLPSEDVRAVGTNTLRKARNAADFLNAGETALGHPIEVIAGREEARLIYVGVAHGVEQHTDQRLVFDIGGGSTEVIIGRGFEPLMLESFHMGCVSLSNRYFGDGKMRRKNFTRACLHAERELEPIREQYLKLGWDAAIGASGTVRTAEQIVVREGWSKRGLTKDSLQQLAEALLASEDVLSAGLLFEHQQRAPVFPGGLAILTALFDVFDIEKLSISNNALREGVLYDLLGRFGEEDVREKTIVSLQERYRIDVQQADRVAETVAYLHQQVAESWGLQEVMWVHLLDWAARLHEIGVDIAHSQYHKHGAYLLEHSDLSGFSRQEQRLLASLVRVHRRKIPKTLFDDLPKKQRQRTTHLAVLLRLGVLLHRSRSRSRLPGIVADAWSQVLRLAFPPGWLSEHPLTETGLAEEVVYLGQAGIRLSYA